VQLFPPSLLVGTIAELITIDVTLVPAYGLELTLGAVAALELEMEAVEAMTITSQPTED
jgi:hypothetical protein